MDGISDITRVNDMIDELKKHNVGLQSDDAFEQAQSMILGHPLIQETDLSPAEKEIRTMGLRMNSMIRDMSALQHQVKSMRELLTVRLAQPVQAPEPVPVAPQEAPVEHPKTETQEKLDANAFDPSVENIFYCGNK